MFILCGAAGLRIGEGLGLEIGKHFSEDFRTLTIAQKVRHCVAEDRLKNDNAARQVDLPPSVTDLLKKSAGNRKSGFLFASKQGKPIRLSNIVRRHLHLALKALNFVNPHKHLEEQLSSGLGERHEAQFIDDQQFVAGDLLLESKQFLLVASLDQLADQSRGGSEAHAVATLAGGQSQGQGDVTRVTGPS